MHGSKTLQQLKMCPEGLTGLEFALKFNNIKAQSRISELRRCCYLKDQGLQIIDRIGIHGVKEYKLVKEKETD